MKTYTEKDMIEFSDWLINHNGQFSDDKSAHLEGKYLAKWELSKLPNIAQKTPVWVKDGNTWKIRAFYEFSKDGYLVTGEYINSEFLSADYFLKWSLTDPFETKQEPIQEPTQEYEPKKGDIGWFWNDHEHVIVDIIFDIGTDNPKKYYTGYYHEGKFIRNASWRNFSKTKPSFLKDEAEN